jgi:hypothetical protein
MNSTRLLLVAVGALLPTSACVAADERVDYLRDIKPILAARCYSCHGALQQKGGLRLDTAAAVREGGDAGPAVAPGKSADSLLIRRVLGQGGQRRMPPQDDGEPLSPSQVARLRAWVDGGAVAPPDEKPEPDPRDHWAFRAPVRPPVPSVPGRPDNPIDAFLAAEQARHGVTPQPFADKTTLLRRVYLDLVGLPPTREELAAFAADSSPDAYERVVDRLLRSPQYGERWGRHFMDIWRYSDWWGLGAEVRNSQKHIWHWRDWIIDSLNADKGYDQMVREMLAADELFPDDLDRLRGTGYLARSYFKFNRNTWLDEVVEHTAKAFLGLTLNCARCHEHKYDPFPQADYYRFRAFFEPYQVRMDQRPGEPDLEKDGLPRVFDCEFARPTYLFVRGDDRQPVKERPLSPGVPAVLSLGRLDIRPVTLPLTAHEPGLRPFVLADHLRVAEQQLAAAQAERAKAQQALGAAPPAGVTSAWAALVAAEKAVAAAEAQPAALRARAAADRARAVNAPDARERAREAALAERRATLLTAEADLARAALAKDEKKLVAARDALVKARKAFDAPGEIYTPLRGSQKTAESNVESEEARLRPFPATSTGRRSALAAWITDRRNPLTARVLVNHVWMRHFGTPLVATVFDFGRKGAPPTHPQLLDWLAAELVDQGWGLKHLHRLIVTSAAYRRTSSSAGARGVDPENRWYGRMNARRLDAQALRDSLLHLAGELDPRLGGPPVPVTDAASRRRSLYFVHSHNDHHKFLATFDDASVLECYRRAESIVPQQALALANSAASLATAAKIADRVRAAPDADFVRAAFVTVLATEPTADELRECEAALRQWTALAKSRAPADAARRARANLVLALLNHNDFITVR